MCNIVQHRPSCNIVQQCWMMLDPFGRALTQHPPNDSKYRIDDKKALEVIFGYIFNGDFVYIFMSVFAISERKIYLTSSQIHPLDVKRIQTNKKTSYIRDFMFSLISFNHFKPCNQFRATFHVCKVRGASVHFFRQFFLQRCK